jgi:DNA-directed RNA polymerase specialized sigma24 family protein
MLIGNSEDIIAGLKLQNPAACEKLFSNYRTFAERYYTKSYGSSFGNIHLDDALQECLRAAMNHSHKFEGAYQQQLDAFAKKMFVRVINCYMRRFIPIAGRTADLSCHDVDFPLETIADPAFADSEENLVLKLFFDQVLEKHITPALTPEELKLFRKLHMDEDLCSYGRSCGISRDAVRKRKSRLLKKVRTLFEEAEVKMIYGS